MQPPTDASDTALDDALARGDAAAAQALLDALAPRWYREARHAELCAACDRLQALMAPREPAAQELPPSLELWRALATWYVAPADALARLRRLAERRGLRPGRQPAAMPQLGPDLYLLAALFRSELATRADPAELAALAQAVFEHLNCEGRALAPVLSQLGGVTAALSWLSLTGADVARLQALSAESLALVARLDDRHSLCSVVALARWPLLRGDMALARETCELITVGLLAGDDAHMPLAHGWLMTVQAELAQPGSSDVLRAWADGSLARAAVLSSPIAPTLLGALALRDAQATSGRVATDLQALVLARAERWSPMERWLARAARCWAHLRDGDLPAARALLRLLEPGWSGPDSLLGLTTRLMDAQVRLLADEPLPALPSADTLEARGWPGPALLVRLLGLAGANPPAAETLQACDAGWRRHALLLPLFTAPALVQRVAERLKDVPASASGWLAALRGAQQAATERPGSPRVRIGLRGGLSIEVDGRPLAFGRKPPRRLLELAAVLALRAPQEQPAHRLADALYPELEGDAALHALDTALYRLRRLLPPGALRRGTVGVVFDAAVVTVDRDGHPSGWLPEFEQAWAEAARQAVQGPA